MQTVLRYDSIFQPLTQCMFSTARSCIYYLIQRFGPGCALLPEWMPEGLFQPFLQSGTTVRQYKLKPDLSPDYASLHSEMRGVERPIVVVVHYFGYTMPTAEAAVLAHEHHGILLADSAMGFFDASDESDCSDVNLVSLNKILPVTDGALMVSRTPLADLTIPESENLPPAEAKAIEHYHEHMLANRLLAKLPATPWWDYAQSQSDAAYEAYYALVKDDMTPRAVSRLARLKLHESSMAEERKRRHDNATALINALPHSALYRTDMPCFALPVHASNRMKTLMDLREVGISASIVGKHWLGRMPPGFENHLLLPINEKCDAAAVAKVFA